MATRMRVRGRIGVGGRIVVGRGINSEREDGSGK